MKIEVRLDENCTETKVIIIAEKMTEEIYIPKVFLIFVTYLLETKVTSPFDNDTQIVPTVPQTIIGFDGDELLLLEPTDIVRIYAAVGKVFAVVGSPCPRQSEKIIVITELTTTPTGAPTRQRSNKFFFINSIGADGYRQNLRGGRESIRRCR